MLSPAEKRGQVFKRYVRSAAALNALYDDTALGRAVKLSGHVPVGRWWKGVKPLAETVYRLADVTGLSADEMTRFLHAEGPPPTLPTAPLADADEMAEVQRRASVARSRSGPPSPTDEGSPGRPAPHEKAGSGRS